MQQQQFLQQNQRPDFMAGPSNSVTPHQGGGADNHTPGAYSQQLGLEQDAATKQMVALSAAGRTRSASQTNQPGTFAPGSGTPGAPPASYFGGPSNTINPATSQVMLQQASSGRPVNPQAARFLKFLAEIHASQGAPLPPTLTGVPHPAYNPATSRFNIIDVVGEGCVRLGTSTLDLYDFFTWVQKAGGSARVRFLHLFLYRFVYLVMGVQSDYATNRMGGSD